MALRERQKPGNYFLPGRLRPLEERKNRFALPTRGSILEMVDIRTRDNPDEHNLLYEEKHRGVLISFIDARLDKAIGNSARLDDFTRRIHSNSPEDIAFTKLITDLTHHFKIVLNCFPQNKR